MVVKNIFFYVSEAVIGRFSEIYSLEINIKLSGTSLYRSQSTFFDAPSDLPSKASQLHWQFHPQVHHQMQPSNVTVSAPLRATSNAPS